MYTKYTRDDFIRVLSDILIRDFGHAADEAERLIKTYSTIVSTATLFHSGTGSTMMSNILPCVIALEMAENRQREIFAEIHAKTSAQASGDLEGD